MQTWTWSQCGTSTVKQLFAAQSTVNGTTNKNEINRSAAAVEWVPSHCFSWQFSNLRWKLFSRSRPVWKQYLGNSGGSRCGWINSTWRGLWRGGNSPQFVPAFHIGVGASVHVRAHTHTHMHTRAALADSFFAWFALQEPRPLRFRGVD